MNRERLDQLARENAPTLLDFTIPEDKRSQITNPPEIDGLTQAEHSYYFDMLLTYMRELLRTTLDGKEKVISSDAYDERNLE